MSKRLSSIVYRILPGSLFEKVSNIFVRNLAFKFLSENFILELLNNSTLKLNSLQSLDVSFRQAIGLPSPIKINFIEIKHRNFSLLDFTLASTWKAILSTQKINISTAAFDCLEGRARNIDFITNVKLNRLMKLQNDAQLGPILDFYQKTFPKLFQETRLEALVIVERGILSDQVIYTSAFLLVNFECILLLLLQKKSYAALYDDVMIISPFVYAMT